MRDVAFPIYIVASVAVMLLNASANYFDPFQGGLGSFSTAVGSSTTGLWAWTIVAIDVGFAYLSFRFFKSIGK